MFERLLITDANANATIGYKAEIKAITEAMKETADSNILKKYMKIKINFKFLEIGIFCIIKRA